MDQRELHPERLGTTDEQGYRVYLYPADVRGRFRAWRTKVQFALLLFFLLLPYVHINGRQALLLNVSRREFDIFGLSLRAHNAPLLFFVLAAAGFGLFFATSIWGRVWCGWACPQTVFIEAVYRRIERWVEGSHLDRKAMAKAPWTFQKIWKRSAKWFLFILASLVITHSFLAYFVGVDDLFHMILRDPRENWTSFLFILFSTGIILFDFAWFREQFCIIACPYGRFQSVLMDDHSMVVAYDTARGEPRRTGEAKALAQANHTELGDCVNCYRCVQVCPTGIDIRRGTQLECIACTACIDACDDVMTKLKKPTGLIRYDSARGLAKDKTKPRKRLRPRSLAYLSIVILAVGGLTLSVARMSPVEVAVLRAKEIPYALQAGVNGAPDFVMNHFKLEHSNHTSVLHQLIFEIAEEARAAGVEVVIAQKPLPIEAQKVGRTDLFMRFPRAYLKNGSGRLILKIIDRDTVSGREQTMEKELTLVGPFS